MTFIPVKRAEISKARHFFSQRRQIFSRNIFYRAGGTRRWMARFDANFTSIRWLRRLMEKLCKKSGPRTQSRTLLNSAIRCSRRRGVDVSRETFQRRDVATPTQTLREMRLAMDASNDLEL